MFLIGSGFEDLHQIKQPIDAQEKAVDAGKFLLSLQF